MRYLTIKEYEDITPYVEVVEENELKIMKDWKIFKWEPEKLTEMKVVLQEDLIHLDKEE